MAFWTNMTPSLKAIHCLQAPDLLPSFLEAGHVSLEEMEEAQTWFNDFRAGLEKEWPATRIKEWRLERKRTLYSKAKKKVADLELTNRDARVRGESYKERKRYTDQLNLGNTVLALLASEGTELKTSVPIAVHDLVTPYDAGYILKYGFEEYLRAKFGH